MKYREFNCIQCGKPAVDRGSTQTAKCCSRKCYRKYWYLNKATVQEVEFPCKYNEGVSCTNHKCNTCGWNPEVEKIRKEAYA